MADQDEFAQWQSQQGAQPDEFAQWRASQNASDPIVKLLNNPSNPVSGFFQGVGKGAASTAIGIIDLGNKVVPNPVQIDPTYRVLVTQPNGPGQGTGKFVEQLLEFAAPESAVSDLTKGASALVRIPTKAALGSTVAAAQSGGDPTSTVLGGVFGAGGEALGDIANAVKNSKPVPTLKNFAKAFDAMPTQKAVITEAFPTLLKDGVIPGDTLTEMQGAIKDKLQNLSGQYQALPADIPTREYDPATIKAELQKQMRGYQRGNVTSPSNVENVKMLQDHMDMVDQLAKQNPNGKLTFEDLKYLRDDANDATDWSTPPSQRRSAFQMGNTYRQAMDQIAPETTQLNQDWQKYKSLEKIADLNVSRMKGDIAPSGLTVSLHNNIVSPMVGSEIGAGVGAHFFGTPGAIAGAAAGQWLYPKLAQPVMKAVQNFADSGGLSKLAPAQIAALKNALTTGNGSLVLRMIRKGAAYESVTGGLNRSFSGSPTQPAQQ